jgi:hypothetical protein
MCGVLGVLVSFNILHCFVFSRESRLTTSRAHAMPCHTTLCPYTTRIPHIRAVVRLAKWGRVPSLGDGSDVEDGTVLQNYTQPRGGGGEIKPALQEAPSSLTAAPKLPGWPASRQLPTFANTCVLTLYSSPNTPGGEKFTRAHAPTFTLPPNRSLRSHGPTPFMSKPRNERPPPW